MTNFEKHKDEILKIAEAYNISKRCACLRIRTHSNYCTGLTCSICSEESIDWLFKEYVRLKSECKECLHFHEIEGINEIGYCDHHKYLPKSDDTGDEYCFMMRDKEDKK